MSTIENNQDVEPGYLHSLQGCSDHVACAPECSGLKHLFIRMCCGSAGCLGSVWRFCLAFVMLQSEGLLSEDSLVRYSAAHS